MTAIQIAALVHTWTIHGNDLVDRSSFNIVDNVITHAGNEMAVEKDINVFLLLLSTCCFYAMS